MKKRYYILIAVFSYLFFTIAQTPAATVISLLEKNITLPAKIYGVQGSIWNGQADTVTIPSQPPINNLKWSLKPLNFLLANLSADIEAEIKKQKVSGRINLGASGNIDAEDIHAQLNAKDIQDLLMLPLGELAGEFDISFDSLELANEGIPKATGQIVWNNAKLTLAETVDLGQITADILPAQDNGLNIIIKNKKGMLSIDGNIEVNNIKTYKLAIKFKPNKNANSNVTQSLAMFAKRQSDGSYSFKQNGNLKQLGL